MSKQDVPLALPNSPSPKATERSATSVRDTHSVENSSQNFAARNLAAKSNTKLNPTMAEAPT